MSEDLTDYLLEMGFKVRYLHSEVDTLERIQIIRDLRLGEYDVLVGVNLLREGLDLPEVSLVAILDADKEGFLRGETSLIQTIGRAARNVDGTVIMYADKRDRGDGGARSTRPTAAARSRSPTTRSTASRRRRSSRAISDIAEFLQAEGKTPRRARRRSERKAIKADGMSARASSRRRSSSSRRRCSPPPRSCASSTPRGCATSSASCAASSTRRARSGGRSLRVPRR